MKTTTVQIIAWVAYISNLIKAGNKTITVGTHDRYINDSGFFDFLRACYFSNLWDGNRKTFWIDTCRKEPMTQAEMNEYILPLTEAKEEELIIICKFAGITQEDVIRHINKLNIEKA